MLFQKIFEQMKIMILKLYYFQLPTGPILSQLELMKIEADIVQAAEYFRRSAEGGDPQGMINWGTCLEQGRGVPINLTESARGYEEAMNRGEIHGMFCYAAMLEVGKGVQRDTARAVQLYKDAADRGHDKAQSKYGLICELGQYGTTANLEEAVGYYRRASDQGSPHGMVCFADMLERGKGVV
jgi:TPR repeat protein